MIGLLVGFFKLTFLLTVAVILIFAISERIDKKIHAVKDKIRDFKLEYKINQCKKKLKENPDDEETKDLLLRLERGVDILCMYDYLFYLHHEYDGWQICPSCKFPGPKNMLCCPNCDYVTPEGYKQSQRIRDWANSEDDY